MVQHYLGLDIGGTKSAVILGKRMGGGIEIMRKVVLPTFEDGRKPMETLSLLCSRGEELLREENVTIAATGVSCGGPLDEEKGLILSPPICPDTIEFPSRRFSKNAFPFPLFWKMMQTPVRFVSGVLVQARERRICSFLLSVRGWAQD